MSNTTKNTQIDLEWLHRPLPREFAPQVFWLGGCLEAELQGEAVHSHVSTFLLRGTSQTLLVDTGHPQNWATVSRNLDDLLGDRPLDFIFPTHSELQHAGNLGRLLEKYPASVVVGDIRDYHLYYPQFEHRLISREAHAAIDLGGLNFTFVPAVVRDLPNTLWGYESTSKTLFVADAFGYAHYHGVGQCALLAEELPEQPNEKLVAFINDAALYWTRFHDVQEAIDNVNTLKWEFPTDVLAPAHGNLITEPDGLTAEIVIHGYQTSRDRKLIEGRRY